MRNYGYKQMMMATKYLKNKDYLTAILNKSDIVTPNNPKLNQLHDLLLERIKPSTLLGGLSPKDGLEKEALYQWCVDLNIMVSGSKSDLIARIISYYDGQREIIVNTSDPRELLFNYYEYFACRDIKFLRKQAIIEKDLECEHKFEEATNYLFEKIFKQKPLTLVGTNHPDGMLAYQNKLIMWDNKSKETPVKLKEHLPQFDKYIKSSEKPVSVFMVIGPDFTEDSVSECLKYSLTSDTLILLIKANDLKNLAIEWNSVHKNDDAAFNLGYFKQSGLFNKSLINIT
jgi:hypothetical protein